MENRKPILIDMDKHNSWGDSISFMDYKIREVTGHMDPIPEVGDFLIKKMKSGKTAAFKIIEIRPCLDPPDMFFGTVTDLGYIEDIQETLTKFGEQLKLNFSEIEERLQGGFKPIIKAIENVNNEEEFREALLEVGKAAKKIKEK